MSWTEQQIQALKQMWGNGFSASDIAKNLGNGITRNAVIGKAHRLKLSVGGAAAVARSSAPLPAKNTGNAIKAITKVSQKRAMLRPLPSVQAPEAIVARAAAKQEIIPSVEILKKPEGIAVTKAGERHCRWPIGDPRSPEFRFCGCKSVDGLPYCVDHARVAYQSLSRKIRNASEN